MKCEWRANETAVAWRQRSRVFNLWALDVRYPIEREADFMALIAYLDDQVSHQTL
jgi:hypothetical protein